MTGQTLRDIPAALEIAALQGEAIFRLGFFEHLEHRRIINPDDQKTLWRKLAVDKRHIVEVADHCGLLRAFNAQFADKPEFSRTKTELCWIAYCALIYDANCNSNEVIVNSLINGYIQHYIPTLYR
jgi:hypothetical protein